MKKIIVFMMVVFGFTLLISCADNQESNVYDDGKFLQYATPPIINYAGDKVITFATPLIGDTKLYYINAKTEQILPLCFDPICNHTDYTVCTAAYTTGVSIINMTSSGNTFYYATAKDKNPQARSLDIVAVNVSDASRKILYTVSNTIICMKFYDNYLYYIEYNADTTNRICRLNINSSSPETILDGRERENDVWYDSFCILDNNIYYITAESDGLYVYNLTTQEHKLLYEASVLDFFIYDDSIYLQCHYNNYERFFIAKYNIESGETAEIEVGSENSFTRYTIYNDKIYIFEREQVEYEVPGRELLWYDESLTEEELEIEKDKWRTYYYNTTVSVYDINEDKSTVLGYYPMAEFDDYNIYGGILYIKGSLAKDLGSDTIAKEDLVGYISVSDGKMTQLSVRE